MHFATVRPNLEHNGVSTAGMTIVSTPWMPHCQYQRIDGVEEMFWKGNDLVLFGILYSNLTHSKWKLAADNFHIAN